MSESIRIEDDPRPHYALGDKIRAFNETALIVGYDGDDYLVLQFANRNYEETVNRKHVQGRA